MTADSATVTLELESRPEVLTLVRGMLGGVAETLAIDAELLDDLKTAVSEACNNVVLHAYPDAVGPLAVRVYAGPEAIEVIVCDQGCGISYDDAQWDDGGQGVGMPVIRALAERSEFRERPEGGTEVWMAFAGSRDGKRLFEQPPEPAPHTGCSAQLSGDAVVSVSPVTLLAAVLGRLARALAASARFSLDRFSDVYLVTDAIADHAARNASRERITFAIKARERRIELRVGPFRQSSASALHEAERGPEGGSPLALLSDELDAEPCSDAEMLRVVLVDHRRWPADSAA